MIGFEFDSQEGVSVMTGWEPGEDATTLWETIEATCGTRKTENVITLLRAVDQLLKANPLELPVGDLVLMIQNMQEMRSTNTSRDKQ